MKRIIYVLIILLFIPAFESIAGFEYPFQNGKSFEISGVDGLKNYFAPNETVEISVNYRIRGSRVTCSPENGFHLQASLMDPDIPDRSIGGFNGNYDDYRHEWYFELKVPAEVKNDYRLEISLYCGRPGAECEEEYGPAAQTSEAYYFNVWGR